MQRTFLILVGFGIALTQGRGLYVADAGAQPVLFQTTRISVSSVGEQGNNNSVRPSISADGRYVAFPSSASNLVPGDTNGYEDVFVHDRACLSITTSPASQTVCAGQPVAFSVTAGGDAPTYRWRWNSIDIPEATESTYAISSAAPEHAGSYDVVVTNDCGSLTSDPATLTVWPARGGDVNDDGLVDGQDVQGFVDQWLAGGPPSQAFCAADMNGDGVVSDAHVPLFVTALLAA